MNVALRFTSLGFRAALIGGFATVVVSTGYSQMTLGRSQIVVQPVPTWAWPYGPLPMPYPYWGPWYSPCYPFASCWAYQQFQIQERRRERLEELRRGQPPAPGLGVETGRGLGADRGLSQMLPSSDADIQPNYLGSGQIRDEYRQSGKFLPQFLEGNVRPSR